MSATFRSKKINLSRTRDFGAGLELRLKIRSLFLRFSFLCFSWGCVRVCHLLIAAEPTAEEWNQVIDTVQQRNLTWLILVSEIDVIPDSIAQLRNLKALWLNGAIARLQCACTCVLTSQ